MLTFSELVQLNNLVKWQIIKLVVIIWVGFFYWVIVPDTSFNIVQKNGFILVEVKITV